MATRASNQSELLSFRLIGGINDGIQPSERRKEVDILENTRRKAAAGAGSGRGWTPQTDAGKLENANDLLNSIENEELLAVLEKVDKLTLEMLAMQMLGYSTPQICCRFNVTAYSYYNRIKRLKEKLKKFFRSD